MPHILVEYSSNLREHVRHRESLMALHKVLSEHAEIENIKSRSIVRENCLVGDGSEGNAFVHVNLRLLPGRTTETKQKIGSDIVQSLREMYGESLREFSCDFTVDIEDMDKESYTKLNLNPRSH
ncbi:MAG: 5-carboxymethyl-2-hydroxymuconate isomerase [Chlamydiales bacterium]|jgi:5-carboxymethyl-2-hydroxymuconate isomerase